MRGDGDGHAFRVHFDQRRFADALVAALGDANVSVEGTEGSWIVSIGGVKTDRLVVRVLDATRDALAGARAASAIVHLGGREYVLDGDGAA